jgi:hypothetical protein
MIRAANGGTTCWDERSETQSEFMPWLALDLFVSSNEFFGVNNLDAHVILD